MSERLAHRGPDDATVWHGGPLALGHRRLSIIDIEGGRQPQTNETGDIQVLLNGEIYNFRELAEELQGKGHRLRTRSDTEAIVHAYEEWGLDLLERLRGMFALALWDERQERLLLARDRLGIKPLFYFWKPARFFAFASEVKALWSDPEIPVEIDVQAIDQYLSLQYVPAPRSGLLGVRKLPPASAMSIQRDSVREWEYWDPTNDPPLQSEPEARGRIREALADAARSHLVSDVPIGTFLSGGVDSGVVTALTATASPTPVEAITVGFRDSALDERPLARAVAQRYRCPHREAVLGLDVVTTFDRMIQQVDEPFADWSALPTYLLAEAARREVKVVLSGDGGDELFGGYARHRVQALENRVRKLAGSLPGVPLERLTGFYPRNFPGHYSFQNLALPPALAIARKHCHGFFSDQQQKARLYGPGIRDRLETTAGAVESYAEPFLKYYERVDKRGPLAAALYLELKTYLVDDILTKVDRMSMAHSLEVRVPFLDHKMVELALAVPAEWKVDWRRGKRIYRDAFGDLLPRRIWAQKKRGFDIPAASWLRGRLRDRAAEILLDAGSQNDLVDRGEVERLWAEHQDGRADHAKKLWALLLLEIWIGNVKAATVARRTRSHAAAAGSEGK